MLYPWTIMSRNTIKILRNAREMLAKINTKYLNVSGIVESGSGINVWK